ncbi:alkylation response protein AidB-like acyl-CoA dehydrogenase [Pseudomonas nitritireducens]|uniref:Alkylation response protein AidB-like acyl-CoA dehydrogenase n=1 Tax=Pseudomonas nitroreducens TaxID=46680 RepID=A0A7W7KGP3_PSENT|nr:acyl-CoA dehydrogenase family protein [Pseudomonas nitritireducens]MBB4862170.1 alkylation response protein AidB-like acyl-CoA dehydrogenase [Pseudomonas nitritireducens]
MTRDGLNALHELVQDFELPLDSDYQQATLGRALRNLSDSGLDLLPSPGSGATLRRWQALATVAGSDLSLLKLYEGHTDALAILDELQAQARPGTWAVWAAEPPGASVQIVAREAGFVRVSGSKPWCSGAALVEHALVTARDEQDRPQLIAVTLDQPGVDIGEGDWNAVGMAATRSATVDFDNAQAQCVGAPQAYLQRPGFWHGGAGIAACWYGAASRLASYLRNGRTDDPHAMAHLGAVDAALAGAAGALRECAQWIDDNPTADSELAARRVRAQVEGSVEAVQWHVGHALGATPFCRDRRFALIAADLPVFLRQSHGERDLAHLGLHLARHQEERWAL